MSQIVSPRDALAQTLQNLLQPDEQLLWSAHPQVKKLRIPVAVTWGIWGFLTNAIMALLFTVYLYWQGSVDFHTQISLHEIVWIYIPGFLIVFLVGFMQVFVKTFTAAFRKAPPYRRSTIYAITDQRAIIIVRFPAIEPTVLSYLPDDIDPAPDLVSPSGWGVLPFSEPRKTRIGRAGPTFVLAGSFIGISHVQEVAALLQLLKIKSKVPAQDSIEQTSR